MTALLLAAVLGSAVPCTTPQPGPIDGRAWTCIDGGWKPPTQAPICEPRPNPYTDPDLAAACAAWAVAQQPPPPPLPTFAPRAVYRDPYRTYMVVLAIVPSVEGVPVIVAQTLAPRPGGVFAFRLDGPDAAKWELVP